MILPRLYVASSWRNPTYPAVVAKLRAAGFDLYDFRNPHWPQASGGGFAWSQIDEHWQTWSPAAYRERLLEHPRAREGFDMDASALAWCDVCVLVLPCGRSAHLELGWAAGAGKRTAVLLSDQGFEPELMYLFIDKLALDVDELVAWLKPTPL